jgi:hypothetical protein
LRSVRCLVHDRFCLLARAKRVARIFALGFLRVCCDTMAAFVHRITRVVRNAFYRVGYFVESVLSQLISPFAPLAYPHQTVDETLQTLRSDAKASDIVPNPEHLEQPDD